MDTEINQAVETAEEQPQVPQQALAVSNGMRGGLDFLDRGSMKTAYQTAQILADSDLVPQNYRGKPSNILIAMDMSARMGVSPMMVMQNLSMIQGRPSWSAQYCISAVNGCGRFTPLKFTRLVDKEGNTEGYYAWAKDRETGEVIEGTPITWKMVKGEGWDAKNGSKWKTMPEQMFKYRAASFFARTYCPDVLNGVYTDDEIKEFTDYVYPEEG